MEVPMRPTCWDERSTPNMRSALLKRVRAQSESGVLALIGPWGSGKSTVLQLAIQQLKGPRRAATDGIQWRIAGQVVTLSDGLGVPVPWTQ